MSEADTRRRYIAPKLYDSGWDDGHIWEQVPITDDRILPLGQKRFARKTRLKPDYIFDKAFKGDL
jgi:type I site-specific restriction endonuclease